MLVTTCPIHTRILTELTQKFNLKSNCESLLVGILSGMSCWAEWTRWRLERKMDGRNRSKSRRGRLFWIWFTEDFPWKPG